MRPVLYPQLSAIARRHGADSGNVDDIVQDAMLAAVETGRLDLADPETRRWLTGVVRNKARMTRRGVARRGRRDAQWQDAIPLPSPPQAQSAEILAGLSPALRTFAALVLTGHNRREIAYLLDLPDTALRQRISALRRHLRARGLIAPDELIGLGLDLSYGRIRDALLPALLRHGGMFASHDPDGHLFIVARSQKPGPRQSGL